MIEIVTGRELADEHAAFMAECVAERRDARVFESPAGVERDRPRVGATQSLEAQVRQPEGARCSR